MKTEEKKAAVAKIAARYPRRESAILPALFLMQKHNDNMLTEQDIKDVAEILGVSVSKTFGVATYHTMFNTKPVGTPTNLRMGFFSPCPSTSMARLSITTLRAVPLRSAALR